MEDIKEAMASRSDKQLEDIIEKRVRYEAASIDAAVEELEKRGRIFSFAELRAIDLDLKLKKRESAEKSEESWYPVPEAINREQTGPAYFAPGSIHLFSIIFSTLFGVVLMAINLYKSGNKRAVIEVIVFGLLYTVATYILLNYIPKQSINALVYSSIPIFMNVAGALILTQIFWRKYLGTEMDFKPRPIALLMAVSLLVCIGFVYFMLSHDPAFLKSVSPK